MLIRLTPALRKLAEIIIPPRAGTGLRHVVVSGERALCGVNVDGWYMERKTFDPETIGCKRCRAVWES